MVICINIIIEEVMIHTSHVFIILINYIFLTMLLNIWRHIYILPFKITRKWL